MNRSKLWVWATVAALGIGTTAAAAKSSAGTVDHKAPQKKSHVSRPSASKHVDHAKPAAKHAEKKAATPKSSKVTKSAKPAAKPQAKKDAVKLQSKAAKPQGRVAKRHA